MIRKTAITIFALAATCAMAFAQKYKYVDKTIAVVGNEAVMISDIENAVKTATPRVCLRTGMSVVRCWRLFLSPNCS